MHFDGTKGFQHDFVSEHRIVMTRLEAELLEEPLVLSTLVTVLKAHTNLETSLLAFDWIFQVLHAVFAFETHFWDAVTCRHQMVVVDELK